MPAGAKGRSAYSGGGEMGVSDERVQAIAEGFQGAGLVGKGWYAALDALAQATGSQSGELIGVGSDAAVPFNIMTNVDADFKDEFVASGGGDPARNPFVRAGMAAPVLEVLADYDCMTPDDYKRNTWYQEFALKRDVPHACLCTVARQPGMVIGLAVVRNRREGPVTPEQRAVFAAVAPHVRAAVQTQIALENNGESILKAAFDGLSMGVFVCDRHGRVRTMTPAAETLVRPGGLLGLRDGVLYASRGDGGRVLSDAIAAAARSVSGLGTPAMSTIVLKDASAGSAMVLEVIRVVNAEHEFSFDPRVLVVARGLDDNGSGRLARVARKAYGLTEAEADVAVRISLGETPTEIAEARQSALGTVRMQLKAAMSKLGVRRQAELVGKLARL